jgi:hypothetical protein
VAEACLRGDTSKTSWSETAAPGIKRILDEERPDYVILNSGIWGEFTDGKDEEEHEAILAVLVAARANARNESRNLRIVWKSTTQFKDGWNKQPPGYARPDKIQKFVAALVNRAEAEVFDAFAITEALIDEKIRWKAYYDDKHFGPAVHAQLAAALIVQLVSGHEIIRAEPSFSNRSKGSR